MTPSRAAIHLGVVVALCAAAALPLLGQASIASVASVAGVVREDSTGKPVMGATVAFEAIRRSVITDAAGKYSLTYLPPGTRLMLVRRLGYEAAGTMVKLVAGETSAKDVILERVPARLDTLAVIEPERRGRGSGLDGFEDRRRLGLGKFIDSTTLRANDDRRFEDVLRKFTSIKIVSPPSCTQDKVGCSKRVAITDRSGINSCPLQVVLDQSVVYRAHSADTDWPLTFDLSSLNVGSLAGVEIYRSTAEVPIEFGGATANCGVLVIWTRR